MKSDKEEECKARVHSPQYTHRDGGSRKAVGVMVAASMVGPAPRQPPWFRIARPAPVLTLKPSSFTTHLQ